MFPAGEGHSSAELALTMDLVGEIKGEASQTYKKIKLSDLLTDDVQVNLDLLAAGEVKFLLLSLKGSVVDRLHLPLQSYVVLSGGTSEYTVQMNLSSTYALAALERGQAFDVDPSKVASLDQVVNNLREKELVFLRDLNPRSSAMQTGVPLFFEIVDLVDAYIQASVFVDATLNTSVKDGLAALFIDVAKTSFLTQFTTKQEALQVVRTQQEALYDSLVNAHVVSDKRATALSVFEVGQSIATVVAEVANGMVADDLERLAQQLIYQYVQSNDSDTDLVDDLIEIFDSFRTPIGCGLYSQLLTAVDTALTQEITASSLKTNLKTSINNGLTNSLPVGGADNYSIPAVSATTLDGSFAQVLTNDYDSDLDTLTITSVTNGSFGAVLKNGNNTLTYTPTNGTSFRSADTFSYTIDDGKCGTAIVTVTVTPILASLTLSEAAVEAGTFPTPFKGTAQMAITISNPSDIQASDLAFALNTDNPWSIVSDTCAGAIVNPSSNCKVVVELDSLGVATYNDTLTVTYNNGVQAGVQTSKAFSNTGTTASVTVAALYPNGNNWNDYIDNDDGGGDVFAAGNVTCSLPAGGIHSACIHGGEKRKMVAIAGVTSCTNLTIADDLGAFNWKCDDTKNPIEFYSIGLKSGKGLKDLLESAAWKTNFVTVSDSSTGYDILQSAASAWWSNAVGILPDSSTDIQELNVASKVYTLSSGGNVAGFGLHINADKISVVLLDATVSYKRGGNLSTKNCKSVDGTTDGGTVAGADDYRCLITASSQNFLWIEGVFDGEDNLNPADIGILLYGSKFSRLHQVKVKNTLQMGLYLGAAQQNLLEQITISNVGSGQVGTESGIFMTASPQNVLFELMLANNRYGLILDGSTDSIISKVTANNNAVVGVYLLGSDTNTLAFVTTANNGMHGVRLGYGAGKPADTNNISNLSTFNNVTSGLYLKGSQANKSSQIQALANGQYGIYLEDIPGVAYNLFYNDLVVVDNPTNSCFSQSGADGLDSINCDAQNGSALDYKFQDKTDGTNIYDITLAYNGLLSANDLQNTSETSGTASYDSELDWFNFENIYRSWGKSGAFPAAASQGACAAGTCQIWDFRMKSDDVTTLYNHAYFNYTGNAIPYAAKYTFSNAAACPTALDGTTQTFVDRNTDTANTYLVHAAEIMFDGIGDEDGLCESSETCIYAAHAGSYFGSGVYTDKTCTFTDGTISGVTMYAY